jgi:Virulence activator alpha C-term
MIFPLKLFFCGFTSPETARRNFEGYQRFLEHRLARYENQRRPQGDPDYHPFPLVLEHGLARTRATLAWIDKAATAIDRQSVESAMRGSRTRG